MLKTKASEYKKKKNKSSLHANMANGVIDRDFIQKLEFERSKFWAQLFDKYNTPDKSEELTMDDLENACKKADNKCHARRSMQLQAKEIDETEVEDECDSELALLPVKELQREKRVLREHTSFMQKTGLDDIFCSFDLKKINEAEENLRRHGTVMTETIVTTTKTQRVVTKRIWDIAKNQCKEEILEEVVCSSESKQQVAAAPAISKLCKEFYSKLKVSNNGNASTAMQKKTKKNGVVLGKKTATSSNSCTKLPDASFPLIPYKEPQAQAANKNMILIYSPSDIENIPSECLNGSKFIVTEAHLAKFIGAQTAMKFMKAYCGSLRFNATSTLYYCLPDPDTHEDTRSGYESDILEDCDRYGKISEIAMD